MKKTTSPASRAPITAQPIPIPAVVPADDFELGEPVGELDEPGKELVELVELVRELAEGVGESVVLDDVLPPQEIQLEGQRGMLGKNARLLSSERDK
jgi:hypothetical protein